MNFLIKLILSMRLFSIILLTTYFVASPVMAQQPTHGKNLGAKVSEAPHWFKESFLEFEEDVAEAAEGGKRVMLYFHQSGCPYCARLIEENFSEPATEAYIRQNFDGITINLWGDREVVTVSGQTFTEKNFAQALRVQYTPTLLFLDESGKAALRLNGYYPPDQFRLALQYVAEKRESDISFSDYALAAQKNLDGELNTENFFSNETDLAGLINNERQPLAVFFESKDCTSCNIMHEKILSDMATKRLVESMTNRQIDVHSDEAIITVDGRPSTASRWARELNIDFTPSVVFFDTQGKEVMRISSFVKTFHFQSVFAYVLEQAYLHEPSFQRYISARAEKLRESGFDTDIWGYQSSYQ